MEANIALLLGDSIEGMKQLPDQTFDYCFTDPPYNVAYKSRWRKANPLGPIANDNLPPRQFQEFLDAAFRELKRLLRPGAALHVCGGWSTADLVLPVLKSHFALKACIVWDKVHLGPGTWYRCQHEFLYLLVNGKRPPPTPQLRSRDIFPIPKLPTGNRLHLTEKPVDLVLQAMTPFTSPGDCVIDPFMGSAPVAAACWRTGRDFIGWEIDEKNYAAALVRMRRLGVTPQTGPMETPGP